MNELLALYNEYMEAVKAADEADAAWEADAENEALEMAFDEAYRKQGEALINLRDEIVKLTSGQIDKITAYKMITKKGKELNDLMALIA